MDSSLELKLDQFSYQNQIEFESCYIFENEIQLLWPYYYLPFPREQVLKYTISNLFVHQQMHSHARLHYHETHIN